MDERVRAMGAAEFLYEIAAYDIHRGWVLPTEYRDRLRAIVRTLEEITPAHREAIASYVWDGCDPPCARCVATRDLVAILTTLAP